MNKSRNNNKEYSKLLASNIERLKELATINKTTEIIKQGKSIDETLHQICMQLPKGWQYPEYTAARIQYDGNSFNSNGFTTTKWCQKQDFTTIDGKTGNIEIYYSKEFEELDEGPFLNEERDLINNLATQIVGYLNGLKAKEILEKEKQEKRKIKEVKEPDKEAVASRQLLQKFLTKYNYNRDLFHDLMPFKVKEILLVANLYDAYSIEKEGQFSDHVLGEYYQLNLSLVPRITGVSSHSEVEEHLRSKHFDMVIIMVGTDKKAPLNICESIKTQYSFFDNSITIPTTETAKSLAPMRFKSCVAP